MTALARELGLTKSVAHRLVRTLTSHGLLDQSSAYGTYSLGLRLIALARRASTRSTLSAVGHRHLERLAQATNEAVFLFVLRAQRSVCVDVVDLSLHVRSVVQLGDTIALHAGAGGKAILAFQSEHLVSSVLTEPLTRYTDRTIIDREAMLAECRKIRAQGWALSEGEVTPGTASVGAPIRDHAGHVVASICINIPSESTALDESNPMVQAVVDAAATLSQDLGYDPRTEVTEDAPLQESAE